MSSYLFIYARPPFNEDFKNKVKRSFREELEVTPGLELVESGTLERTMFKAKRVEDRRAKAS